MRKTNNEMRTPNMKKIVLFFSLLFIFSFTLPSKQDKQQGFKFQEGDIVLQTSESKQCEAVRMATNSKFSHCGIVFYKENKLYVLEAVQPVKMTPIKSWIQQGKGGKYLVRRLKDNSILKKESIRNKMMAYGEKQLNKNYDLYFEWSDDKMYCSELVWKIYKEGTGLEITSLRKLKSFKLDNPVVKSILEERYGKKIPYEEKVVAPSQLAESEKLNTVFSNY